MDDRYTTSGDMVLKRERKKEFFIILESDYFYHPQSSIWVNSHLFLPQQQQPLHLASPSLSFP
jgi:hypothetical protein